jgi:hypothetical protein
MKELIFAALKTLNTKNFICAMAFTNPLLAVLHVVSLLYAFFCHFGLAIRQLHAINTQ